MRSVKIKCLENNRIYGIPLYYVEAKIYSYFLPSQSASSATPIPRNLVKYQNVGTLSNGL